MCSDTPLVMVICGTEAAAFCEPVIASLGHSKMNIPFERALDQCNPRPPHFILLDWDMRTPLEGTRFLRQFRDVRGGHLTKVIALSSKLVSLESNDAKAAGADHFIWSRFNGMDETLKGMLAN